MEMHAGMPRKQSSTPSRFFFLSERGISQCSKRRRPQRGHALISPGRSSPRVKKAMQMAAPSATGGGGGVDGDALSLTLCWHPFGELLCRCWCRFQLSVPVTACICLTLKVRRRVTWSGVLWGMVTGYFYTRGSLEYLLIIKFIICFPRSVFIRDIVSYYIYTEKI